MKKFSLTVLGATILALVFAVSLPVYAQDDKADRQDDKAAQDEKHPEDKQDEGKPAQKDDKQVRDEKQDKTTDRSEKQEGKTTERETTQVQHSGGRIPEDKFRAHFGSTHVFVINRPVIVAGVPRFQYGGYWFAIGQPWPTGWAYTDQVYVDFIDGGYYLLSPVHPGVQISINVVL